MTEIHNFGTPITCHAWNKDSSELALSPNNNEVHIYKRESTKYRCLEVLAQHDLHVTSIDWAPKSNRIVTCAADRNAYVWTLVNGKWKPTLVLLRTNRAATCVKWSPHENKFAVGSGARLIAVCYFEKENDWWVSKHIKKPVRSTVTSVDWHPNNVILACSSTDFKTRVFSSYIKEVDEKTEPTPWGSKTQMGQLLAEFSNSDQGGGWVHCVSFSASGNRLAWVGHDSSISVVDCNKGMVVSVLKHQFLPFLTCTWLNENTIIAAGHNYCPVRFAYDGQSISLVEKMDQSTKKESGNLTAMRKFQSLVKNATTDNVDTILVGSVHQNAITQVSIHSGSKSAVYKFCTTGVDGQLVIWDNKN